MVFSPARHALSAAHGNDPASLAGCSVAYQAGVLRT